MTFQNQFFLSLLKSSKNVVFSKIMNENTCTAKYFLENSSEYLLLIIHVIMLHGQKVSNLFK